MGWTLYVLNESGKDESLANAVARALRDLPRHPDARYQGSYEETRDHYVGLKSVLPLAERRSDAEARAEFEVLRQSENGLVDAWQVAVDLAARFFWLQGQPEMAAQIRSAVLACGRADTCTTSCTRAGDTFVVGVDSGMMSTFVRTGRFYGMWWQWEAEYPERIRAQPRFPGPGALERMFRLWFRGLRWNGYVASDNAVVEPASGRGLGMQVSFLSAVYLLLHEIAHGVAETDGSIAKDVDPELAADYVATLVMSTAASHGPVPPGLVALAVRHFYLTLEAIEGAIYMVRPRSHPSVVERRKAAGRALWRSLGPTGALLWSSTAEMPLRRLVELANMAPPWALPPGDDLSNIFSTYSDYVVASPVDADGLKKLSLMERMDIDVHFPVRYQHLVLGHMVDEGVLAEADDLSYCELPLADRSLSSAEPLPGAEARGSAAMAEAKGRAWFERLSNGPASAVVRHLESALERDGLLFSSFYWSKPIRALPHRSAAVASWSLVAASLGWKNPVTDGMRAWGTKPGGDIPLELHDLEWVAKNPSHDDF